MLKRDRDTGPVDGGEGPGGGEEVGRGDGAAEGVQHQPGQCQEGGTEGEGEGRRRTGGRSCQGQESITNNLLSLIAFFGKILLKKYKKFSKSQKMSRQILIFRWKWYEI